MSLIYRLLERRQFSNFLFPNRHNRVIYPLEFFTKIFRYHKNKNVSLDDIEENIGISIMEYYFVISDFSKRLSENEKVLYVKRLVDDFIIIIEGVFQDMKIFQNMRYIYFTKCLLLEMHYSMTNIDNWIQLMKVWYSKSLTNKKIETILLLMKETLDMILSYDTRIDDIREDVNIQKIISFGKESIYLLLNNTGRIKTLIQYFCNNVRYSFVPALIRAIFYTNNPTSLRIRNYMILKYYCQERSRNISFHNITNFIRRRIMYDGDFQLYQAIHIIMLGLEKGVVIWNTRKRVKYMKTKISLLNELKCRPPTKFFPGGEDYRNAFLKFNKLIQ